MQITDEKLNGAKTSCKIYDGAWELVEHVKAAIAAGHVSDYGLGARCREAVDFLGREFESATDLIAAVGETWDHGMAVLEDMREKLARTDLPRPTERRRRAAWDEFDGDDICNDRLRGGQQFWRRMERREIDAPKIVTINCGVGCIYSVAADNVLWRAAAAIAMTELLESAGYSVELWYTSHSESVNNSTADAASCLTAIKVKAAGESVNPATLVNAGSAWFYRTLIFATRNILGKWGEFSAVDHGKHGTTIPQAKSEGFAKVVCPYATGPVLTIDECFSFESAVSTARTLLEQFAETPAGV